MAFVLSCCDTADLTAEHFLRREIHTVPFHYRLNGTEYPDASGRSLSSAEFYSRLQSDTTAQTAQPGIGEYLEHFSPFLSQGLDVLHVCLSGGLSGACHSARNAALIAGEQFPDRRVVVVDSLGASSGYGMLMDTLADLRDRGASLEETAAWAEDHKLNISHLFFSQDLSYYVRGGRISKAAALFGGVLNICPVLDMDEAGHLIPREKVRGKKQAIRRLVQKMAQAAEDGPAYNGKCYISQSACVEDARALIEQLELQFPALKGRVEINDVGPVIGCHTGPGTVALFFFGASRAVDSN